MNKPCRYLLQFLYDIPNEMLCDLGCNETLTACVASNFE